MYKILIMGNFNCKELIYLDEDEQFYITNLKSIVETSKIMLIC